MYDVFQSYSPYFLLQLLLSFNSFWNSSNIPFPVSWAHLPTPCLFHNSPNPVSSVHTHRHARQSTGAEHGQPTRGHTPKENRFFLRNRHGLPIASQLETGACVSLPHPCWSVGSFGNLALCRQSQQLLIP